jgi:hypothetical protein
MMRRLFTIATAISLLLCVAIVVVWVRSYWTYDWIGYTAPMDANRYGQWCRLGSGGGALEFLYSRQIVRPRVDNPTGLDWISEASWGFSLFAPERNTFWFRHNFANDVTFKRNGYRMVRILVPDWIPLVLLGFLPAFRFSRWFHRKRWLRSLHCPTCGYDVRASKDRCPECGTPIPVKQESGAVSN